MHNFNATTPLGAALTGLAYSQRSSVLSPVIYNAVGLNSLVASGSFDVNTGAAGTFTASSTTDLLTKSNHGYYLGLVVQVSNSGGALPSGLAAATDYYVIPASANTFYLATTLANAQNAVNIDLADNGSGTNTVTPTAIASATVALQGSNDNGANWQTVSNCSDAITADGTFQWQVNTIDFESYSFYFTIPSGSVTFSPIQIGYA